MKDLVWEPTEIGSDRSKLFEKACKAQDVGAALQIALEDIKALIRKPWFKPAMSNEWATIEGGKCLACLGGAVMIRSLGMNLENRVPITPFDAEKDYSRYVRDMLYQIDRIRVGDWVVSFRHNIPNIREAVLLIECEYVEKLGRAPWKYYSAFVKAWDTDMKALSAKERLSLKRTIAKTAGNPRLI